MGRGEEEEEEERGKIKALCALSLRYSTIRR